MRTPAWRRALHLWPVWPGSDHVSRTQEKHRASSFPWQSKGDHRPLPWVPSLVAASSLLTQLLLLQPDFSHGEFNETFSKQIPGSLYPK